MRPEVNAGPIDRRRRPLNVGVDIGSRGVGDASGVGDADGVGDGAIVGDGDGCCAATSTKQTNESDNRSNARAHAEAVIKGLPFSICVERF
jgi:hypothetical protein